MRAVVAILLVLALGGCATTSATVPPHLLTCADQPKSPAGDPAATQRQAALFVVDLAAAGDDCRTKLGSVRRLLLPENTK